MNRRKFLRIVGGTGLALPSLIGQSGCVTALTLDEARTGLSHDYVCGDVTPDSALVWLRADAGSRVALQYGKDPSLAENLSTDIVSVSPAADNTTVIALDRLDPATRYYYRAMVAGKKPGPLASFVTAPWPEAEAPVTFCFSGDTRETYKPFTVMNAVRAQRPDFFLYLGDTVYADLNGRARTKEQFWAKYRNNRDDFALRTCFRETSVCVAWDDHEVSNDYLPTHPLAPIGQKAFFDYWPIRSPSAEPQRIYRSFRWGKAVELFILDTRQYRNPAKQTMLGSAQEEWLLGGIAKSSALFKFIATSVPMAGGGSDRWDGYPKERESLLRYINQKKIRGVVFLSADMHYAAITRIPKSGGLKDITAGPLGAPLNRVTYGTARRYEYFLAENFNFVKITVDPKSEPDKVSLEFIDQDNRVFHSAKIRAG